MTGLMFKNASARPIYHLLPVEHEIFVTEGEKAINRGRRKRGPYIDCRVDNTPLISNFFYVRSGFFKEALTYGESLSTIVTRSRLPCVISSYTLTRDQNL